MISLTPLLRRRAVLRKMTFLVLTLPFLFVSKAQAWSIIDFTGTVNPLSVTENAMFNYFFTLVVLFGLVSLIIAMLVKLISKS